MTEAPHENSTAAKMSQPIVDRIAAIDVLRGLAVWVWGLSLTAIPVFYAVPSSVVREGVVDQLSPSIWHGLTLFDLVLPAFLVAVGAAVVFEITQRRRDGITNGQLVMRIAWRACLLFLIGLVCEWWGSPSIEAMRYTGVFQRIAVCYFAAGMIGLCAGWRLQAGLVALILLEYWVMLELIEVPEYGAGNYGVEGNAVAFVDRLLLPGRPYFATWDPLGLLSTLPALVLTFIGMLLGERLLHDHETGGNSHVAILLTGMLAANCGILAGEFVPLNPHMGTPSFVIASSGILLVVLGLTGMIADSGQAWLLSPFIAMGRNALLLVIAFACIPTLGVVGAMLAILVVFGVALVLYHRRSFLTLSLALPR